MRNYKLSILDQMVGSHYTPMFFLYNFGHHDMLRPP
nr:salutaridinol 7-O-acetyltransferase-like [Ipomoea batatas]